MEWFRIFFALLPRRFLLVGNPQVERILTIIIAA